MNIKRCFTQLLNKLNLVYELMYSESSSFIYSQDTCSKGFCGKQFLFRTHTYWIFLPYYGRKRRVGWHSCEDSRDWLHAA